MEQVKFTEMKFGDREDYEFLEPLEVEYASGVGVRTFDALAGLADSFSGYQVSRLGHSVQSATRAWRDGADIDWVVCALLHDIGDTYAPYNHEAYAAIVMEPFIREQCVWTTKAHGDFQKYYYADKIGGDQNARDKYKNNAYFDDCVDFCERWDQTSFDPAYDDLPLEFFRHMVMEVFARTPYDPDVLRPGAREPLVDKTVADQRA
jgi:predicted HD phosphohydrolase